MENKPNYSLYHLHELERALINIDPMANPEEAEIIKGYIAKGGFVYPKEPKIVGVRFVNSTYKWALVAVLAYFFLINLYTLVSAHNVSALVPLTLQGTILFMIYRNHKYTRGLIKAWSALLIVSGVAGILSKFYAFEIDWSEAADHILTFAGGVLIIVLSNKFVELVSAGANSSPNSDAR